MLTAGRGPRGGLAGLHPSHPYPALDVHAVDRYLWLAPLLALPDGPPDFRLPAPPEAEVRVDALIDRHGLGGRRLAVLVPGTLWETKHWHVEGFAEVARRLVRTGRAVALAGSAAERTRCQAVAALCPGRARPFRPDDVVRSGGPDPAGGGLRDQRLGVDAPDGRDGPAGGQVCRPDGSRSGSVRTAGRARSSGAGVACSPCYLRRLRDCPNGHACMTEVSGAMVVERLEELLANRAASGAA